MVKETASVRDRKLVSDDRVTAMTQVPAVVYVRVAVAVLTAHPAVVFDASKAYV